MFLTVATSLAFLGGLAFGFLNGVLFAAVMMIDRFDD